jgi:putative endonuclease
MYIVYIIRSQTTGRYYIGSTHDLHQRLAHHNSGANRSTKGKGPWEKVYTELQPDKTSALKRERQIKSYKGGNAFYQLINPHGEVA